MPTLFKNPVFGIPVARPCCTKTSGSIGCYLGKINLMMKYFTEILMGPVQRNTTGYPRLKELSGTNMGGSHQIWRGKKTEKMGKKRKLLFQNNFLSKYFSSCSATSSIHYLQYGVNITF